MNNHLLSTSVLLNMWPGNKQYTNDGLTCLHAITVPRGFIHYFVKFTFCSLYLTITSEIV